MIGEICQKMMQRFQYQRDSYTNSLLQIHSNVNLVAIAVFKNINWINISFQSIKEIMNQNFISIYEENRPFECEFCAYTWKMMNQNFAWFHEENKTLECEYCGYPWNE